MTITIGLETIVCFQVFIFFVVAIWFSRICKKMDEALRNYETIHKCISELTLKTWVCMGLFGFIVGSMAVICIYE